MMTMGSLFDGIGGFPLAAVRNGIAPVWASEIEAFPIEVTKIRFPEMLHVGDITKLNGAKLPPVDVICGGSPCQDLSVAGQRAGLAGARSGLFMEQTRITKEMRKADEQRNVPAHLVRPRYLVWENVPGAFSSADGEDFRAVIEEIIRIKYSACDVPRPESGRWESAGAALLGDEFSLAWRVMDAQFWGVAQRRRRIFLVADFGGTTAPEILFKQDGLFGDTPESGGPRQGTAAPAQGSADAAGGACLTPWDVQSRRIFEETGTWPALYSGEGGGHGYIQTEEKTAIAFAANQRDEVRDLHDVAGAIQAQPGMKQQTFVAQPLICLNDQGGNRMDITEEVTSTLRAGMGGHPPLVSQPNCLNGWDTQQSRVFTPEGMAPTLAGADGGGGRNPAGLLFAAGVVSKGDGDCFLMPEVHTAITGGGGQAGQGYPCVLTAGFCGNASAEARGIGYQAECSPTIKTGTAPSVLCLNDQGGSQMHCTEDITGTLRAQEHGHQPLVFENHGIDSRYSGPHAVAPTMSARMGTGGNNVPLVGTPVAFSLDSKESNSMKSANPYSGCRETDVARTIDTGSPDPSKNQGGIAILQETICIAGNTIDREPENGGNGLGCQPDISYTITTSDRHAVCEPYQEVVGALCRGDEKGIGSQYVSQNKCIVERRNLIRRLTPLECERLQGFPDGWTLIPGASDSARYKALGNSVAIPCVDFVLRGIAYFLQKIYEEQEE
ncbi:Cytosine-specific methyltransferase [Desulfitobacterium hafniense]|uniref:DNA (cytosine-5-)-methyltransferase n=1 Tax=Desulfitobacterium hafniense TaxID=49338 RepID=A0A098AUG7_DESHA|nr:DNA cytosine methyltransferase [Desulfitobacterium hafniense]CDX00008.1 Cytosine-specific methyltransferase [Desulfitobacterium hafniense]